MFKRGDAKNKPLITRVLDVLVEKEEGSQSELNPESAQFGIRLLSSDPSLSPDELCTHFSKDGHVESAIAGMFDLAGNLVGSGEHATNVEVSRRIIESVEKIAKSQPNPQAVTELMNNTLRDFSLKTVANHTPGSPQAIIANAVASQIPSPIEAAPVTPPQTVKRIAKAATDSTVEPTPNYPPTDASIIKIDQGLFHGSNIARAAAVGFISLSSVVGLANVAAADEQRNIANGTSNADEQQVAAILAQVQSSVARKAESNQPNTQVADASQSKELQIRLSESPESQMSEAPETKTNDEDKNEKEAEGEPALELKIKEPNNAAEHNDKEPIKIVLPEVSPSEGEIVEEPTVPEATTSPEVTPTPTETTAPPAPAPTPTPETPPATAEWNPQAMINGLDLRASLESKYGGVSGKLTGSELETVGEQWGRHRLESHAAQGLRALNEAFKAEFGKDIDFTDSYRSFEAQQDAKRRKPRLTATPGKSNHGWGQAVDFSSNINNYNSKEHKWMIENAWRYGWILPDWAQENGSKPEPWHFEWVGLNALEGKNLTVPEQKAPETLSAEQIERQKQITAAMHMAELGPDNILGRAGVIMRDYLRNTVLTPEQIAGGPIGSAWHESAGIHSSMIQNGGKGPAGGIWQWEHIKKPGSRFGLMKKFAEERGKTWADFDSQVQFSIAELKGQIKENNESRAYRKLRETKSVTEAAVSFSQYYERPGIPHNDRRIAHGQEAYEAYMEIYNNLEAPDPAPAPSPEIKPPTSEAEVKKEQLLDHPDAEIAAATGMFFAENDGSITKYCDGRTNCRQYCAAATSIIWGKERSGHYSAKEMWKYAKEKGMAVVNSEMPVGALMYYDGHPDFGHVAVYVGDGKIVTNYHDNADGRDKFIYMTLERAREYYGEFYGWSGPEVFRSGPRANFGSVPDSYRERVRAMTTPEEVKPAPVPPTPPPAPAPEPTPAPEAPKEEPAPPALVITPKKDKEDSNGGSGGLVIRPKGGEPTASEAKDGDRDESPQLAISSEPEEKQSTELSDDEVDKRIREIIAGEKSIDDRVGEILASLNS